MSNKIFGDETHQALHDLADALRRERDQLGIQLNLGKMELRDEWEDVEEKWRVFERKVDRVNEETKQSLHEVGQEIAEIYNKLKRHLN